MDLEKGMKVGNELLNGKGLNHSAFTRELLSKEDLDQVDRNKTKKLYTAIFDGLSQENGKAMYKDGHDYFLKQEVAPKDQAIAGEAKDRISELETENKTLQAENARLNGLIGNLKDKISNTSESEKPVVLRTWRYNHKTGEGKIFDRDKIGELSADWKDHPKPK